MSESTSPYEMVIGLEVHVQLSTATKIFSGCVHGAAEQPNIHTDPVTLGLPGTLPVLNGKAVRYAVMMGLATHCQVRTECRFARKHYFYPDLPKGYQISQYDEPLCETGYVDVAVGEEGIKRIRINRIHMEDDAGKIIHGHGGSRVDYNRAGVPLIEIVSEPDIHSPEEAVAYLKTLHSIVRYLGISDGNMERGNFRFDANISLRKRGEEKLGTKTELKNLNSFRHVHRSLIYEAQRQERVLSDGGEVVQETRLWDESAGKTATMRSKEDAHDYRYFPDPDLLPLVLESQWIESIRAGLPELAEEKRERLVSELGLPMYDASVLTASPELASFYDAVLADFSADPKLAANWVMTELLGHLSRDGKEVGESPMTPQTLAKILGLIHDGTLSAKMAKTVFEKSYGDGTDPNVLAKEMGGQISDKDSLVQVVQEVLSQHESDVADYQGGNKKVVGFLVGQVMRATKGKANPKLVNEILLEELNR